MPHNKTRRARRFFTSAEFNAMHAAADVPDGPACGVEELRARVERLRTSGWSTAKDIAAAEAELEEAEAAVGIKHLKQGQLL